MGVHNKSQIYDGYPNNIKVDEVNIASIKAYHCFHHPCTLHAHFLHSLKYVSHLFSLKSLQA